MGGLKMARDSKELLEKLNIKISQLQAQRKAIENKERLKEKRAHELKLLKYGELVEKWLKVETVEELEEILKKLVISAKQ
jgi:hypothetical protein